MPKYFVTAYAKDTFSQVVSAHSEDEAAAIAKKNPYAWKPYQSNEVQIDAKLITA